VWGRLGKASEKVGVGDWVLDEKTSRVRRLVSTDKGKVTEARRFFPGHCGSWVFSEKTRKWTPLEQPLSGQPSGRILPGAAYDSAQKKIVLFGGDDLSRCLADTWHYDCASRKWEKVAPQGRPPARAAQAMVYVPHAKVVLMAGGYGTGWAGLKDTWVYDAKKPGWTRLGIDLPAGANYCSADYVPEEKLVLLRLTPVKRGLPQNLPLCGLRLELSSAPKAAGTARPEIKYHCMRRLPPSTEYDPDANKGLDPAAGRAELAALPANTWVLRKTPLGTASRTWGSYTYDVRTHRAYAWGGGHKGYQGADVSEYDVLRNRWRGMVDPPEFKHPWRHQNSGDAPPGLTYSGSILVQSHARKSYAVDPLTNTLVTSHGDLYDIAERRFVGSIGRCPGKWSWGDQVVYVSTPHGLYAFTAQDGGRLYRANVSGGRWDVVGKGGPRGHSEYNPMTYDSKRDRIVYLACSSASIWVFDFKEKKWSREEREGAAPEEIGGDPAYVPELDALLFVIGPRKGGPLSQYFYKVAERRWYRAPYKGAQTPKHGNSRLCNSIFYDPKLKTALRVTGHYGQVQVLAMRLVPGELKLEPVK
jgi:hypothetical protein